MAYTSSKGFLYRGSMISPSEPVVQSFIIDNSKTITIGDAITLAAGFATVSAGVGGDNIAGICVGIVDASGIPVWQEGADVDGTLTGDDTYASAADNQTDKKCKVQVVPTTTALWYNEADSTLAQAEEGLYFDLTNTGDQVTGTGNATKATMQLVKMLSTASGPNSFGEGLFKIAESYFQVAAA